MITSQTMAPTPYPVVQELPAGFIGSQVHLIGYGVDGCPNGDSGTKYRTTDEVYGWYDSNTYATLGNGANSGDSGGPVFDQSYNLVGVMVAVDGQCQGYTVVTRADHFIDLISQAVLDSGGCFPTGPEICFDGVDNDCNDLVDDGCTAIGQPCAVDTDCYARLCVNLGGGLACAEPCDAADPLATCGIGGYCREVACGRGACAAGLPGAGQPRDLCQYDTDCASLYCRTWPDGIARCGARCDLAGADCFLGEACLAQGDTCGICAPDALTTGPRGLGEACAANLDCTSSLCIADGVNHYCSTSCTTSDTCPDDWHCRSGFCVRGREGLAGDPCEVAEDCFGGLICYSHGDLRYCTELDCDDASNPCPTGFTCTPEGTTAVCTSDKLPVGEPCTDNAECQSGACLAFNGVWSCALSCDHQDPCPTGTYCAESDNGLVGCAPNTTTPGHPNANQNQGGGGGGGCQSAPGPAASLLWLLALGLALAWRRRS
jgi:MYXO-CTERM domain-containing protein